ncbi:S8 family peptidase [Aquimarina agarivorans]|uniref:S8 family peptidase n=1 Tax=Aquimarina agarivorans TaxID=980584 RepID=UPI000248FDA9|nr:S8 family peptidase [Aquimarina agarivorans]
MKRIFKIAPVTFSASLLLTSCFSTNPTIINTPAEKVDNLPLKTTAITQEQLKNWNQSDLLLDTIPGMSVDRAYSDLLAKRKGKTVIVAVIDSGIDINHEDLKGKIWVNKKERPNNGKDDDKNGYVDDVNGWNFLGDVVAENMEFTRIIRDYKDKFEGKTLASISEKDKEMFQTYEAAKTEYAQKVDQNNQRMAQYEPLAKNLKSAHTYATKKFATDKYTQKDLFAWKPTADEAIQHRQLLVGMYPNVEEGKFFGDFVTDIEEYVEYFKERQQTHFNLNLYPRKILNNDPDNFETRIYGNNKVGGPDPKLEDAEHGTHVAGIIAANRKNTIGMKGIAENVKIMPVRAVPDGDEYDKDIAMAIRYAVDNGAKVINTSFGKYFSTHPDWVRDAIRYAAKKDVLIVNAAGNESKDLDVTTVYPNDQTLTGAEISDNFITIGALNYDYGTRLVADFSNYGKQNVDVFAPGVKIYSTVPNSKYEFLQGTSMAAPAVSGAAAVLRSYFPNLTAKQVKTILMESGNASKTNVVVGSGIGKSFQETSKSGKMVNLYNAILLAQRY